MSLVVAALITPAVAQEFPVSMGNVNSQEQMKKAREAMAKKDVEGARGLLETVRNDALERRDDVAGLMAVNMLALLARTAGDWGKTEDWLAEALDFTGRLKGYKSLEAADVMTAIAGARRARENFEGAAAILQEALNIASSTTPELARAARIATTLGLVHLERNEADQAREVLLLAVRLWDGTMQEDPELLPALETLGAILRDKNLYDEAAPLYERSLRIREISFGPRSAELIVGLDNLAYVYFGLMRYADAEPLYKRLLEIWTSTGGPDHPMLALTMDKIAEFYAAQSRFLEADEMANRAATIRARSFVGSLRLRARLAALMNKPEDAIGFSEKALQVIDIAGLPKPEQKILPAPKDAKPVPPAKPNAAKPARAIKR
jgi:tetratricopeptide (TPR) repeat protein